MSPEIVSQLSAAIERARNWCKAGWQVDFGPNRVAVRSLEQALQLPREFPYREEALAYWRNVQCISEEVVSCLKGALDDLERGDLKAAGNKLYFAQYFERPLEESSRTCKPLYESFQRLSH